MGRRGTAAQLTRVLGLGEQGQGSPEPLSLSGQPVGLSVMTSCPSPHAHLSAHFLSLGSAPSPTDCPPMLLRLRV